MRVGDDTLIKSELISYKNVAALFLVLFVFLKYEIKGPFVNNSHGRGAGTGCPFIYPKQ